MLPTTELIVEKGLANYILTDQDIAQLVGGSPARKYGILNKMVHAGESIRLKRGIYMLAPKYHTQKIGKFYIASQLKYGSYISLESALSFHGWILERVETVTSVIAQGRSETIQTPMGEFSFLRIPTNTYTFFNGVDRKITDDKPFLIASPLRALADYVYEKKITWHSLDFLSDNLRIDETHYNILTKKDFELVKSVYRSRRVINYLIKLEKGLIKNGYLNY